MSNRLLSAISQWRANRLEVKLAGLRAKLAATKTAIGLVEKFPRSLLHDLSALSLKIAELEEKQRQIRRFVKN